MNLKRRSPHRDTLILYVIDYDFNTACLLFHLTEEQANKIIYPREVDKLYKYNTVIDKPICKDSDFIMKVIANHYDELYKKLTPYEKDVVYMSLSSEDFFHKGIIKLLEKGVIGELTEDNVIKSLITYFNTERYYSQVSSYSMKGKLTPLEIQNEEGEYIIPSEYANTKESTEAE